MIIRNMTERDKRNLRRVQYCFMGYIVLWGFSANFIKGAPMVLGWTATGVSAVAGLFLIFAYVQFLRHADELLRTIQLHALAFGFGGGFVSNMVYRLCERLGAPRADIMDGNMALFAFFWIGMFYGVWRYR